MAPPSNNVRHTLRDTWVVLAVGVRSRPSHVKSCRGVRGIGVPSSYRTQTVTQTRTSLATLTIFRIFVIYVLIFDLATNPVLSLNPSANLHLPI